VDADGLHIRRLSAGDAAPYRDIRLESLRLEPDSFGSSFARESAKDLTWFAQRLTGTVTFGALRGPLLIGTAGYYLPEGEKSTHKGVVWGTYVRPDARRAGVARGLMEAVIAAAGERVELLELAVVSTNEAARRLYAGLGFEEYGYERRALKSADGRYADERLMVKFLTPLPD
jgi:ribosomal protein S18 acetylase RimI-like enzyme